MIMQLSSGIGGPLECAFAVNGILRSLLEELPGAEVLEERPAGVSGCLRSAVFARPGDLSFLEGTMLWVCRSPFRPHHRRRNWYVACAALPEPECPEEGIGPRDLIVTHLHAGGPGGQNVNKVETGVRMTHLPTGIVVTCTAERSQAANRREAERRLTALLRARADGAEARRRDAAWRKHAALERGNPVRTYRGMGFALDG